MWVFIVFRYSWSAWQDLLKVQTGMNVWMSMVALPTTPKDVSKICAGWYCRWLIFLLSPPYVPSSFTPSLLSSFPPLFLPSLSLSLPPSLPLTFSSFCVGYWALGQALFVLNTHYHWTTTQATFLDCKWWILLPIIRVRRVIVAVCLSVWFFWHWKLTSESSWKVMVSCICWSQDPEWVSWMQNRKDYFKGACHSCVDGSGAPSSRDRAAWRSQKSREPGEHPSKSHKLNYGAQNLGMWPCF